MALIRDWLGGGDHIVCAEASTQPGTRESDLAAALASQGLCHLQARPCISSEQVVYTAEKYFKLNLTSESSRLLPVERQSPPAAGLAATSTVAAHARRCPARALR